MTKSKAFKVAVFIVVLLIPVIYSFFYLKAYWDPYGNLSDIKIAVVNLDEGIGEENQGKEFVKSLKESGTFNICEVTLEKANEGIKDGEYYAMIQIPNNFSSSLNSAAEENKQIATITYTPNKAKNYLATQIINSAIKTMEINLQGKVSNKVAQTLIQNIETVPESLQEISNGTEKLLEGTQSLSNGLNELKDGTETLNTKYSEFDNGIQTAYSGSEELSKGISQVNEGVNTLTTGGNSLNTAMSQIDGGVNTLLTSTDSGIEQLSQGINVLSNGSETLKQGVNTYTAGSTNLANGIIEYTKGADSIGDGVTNYVEGVNNVNTNVEELLNGIIAYGQANPNALQDPNIAKMYGTAQILKNSGAFENLKESGNQLKQGTAALKNSSTELNNGANQIINSSEQLNQGAEALNQGIEELVNKSSGLTEITKGIQNLKSATLQVKEGTEKLNTGISSLQQGTKAVENGINSLTNGLKTLKESSTVVAQGIGTLNSGAKSAYNGSKELSNGVVTLKNGIDEGITNANAKIQKLKGLNDFVENPVEFKEESYGEVNSYGIAFTPLFMGIGLWVGSLMCYVVLYYDQKNRFGIFGSDAANKHLQNLLYIIIGAVEGVITGFLLKLGLGFGIENLGLYYSACLIMGITFMSIIQFLIRNFNDVGKLLALVILVLQLAAAGGTFPIETVTKGFRGLQPFLPMTYSINLLKEILVPTQTNLKGQYFAILIGISIVCIAITYVVDYIRNKKVEN